MILAKTTGTELAHQSAPSESKAKKITRTVFAGVMSVGLIGAFAFPAYAAIQPEDNLASVSAETQTQNLRTDVLPDTPLPAALGAAGVEDDLVVLERERAEEEAAAEAEAQAQAEEAAAAQARQATTTETSTSGAVTSESVIYQDVPSGAGAQGLLAAAVAQLGDWQDCTALVERSLRAIGHPVGDLGTAIWQYDPYGTRVSINALAPGDILIYGNARSGAHVAIYEGNGIAIHGGFPGGTVRAGVHAAWEPLTGAIRPH